MSKKQEKCYYCGAEATSKEHVPPLCFFPEGQRKNLITVPACDQHNKDLSIDQEYARNMVALYYFNNIDGTQLAIEKAFKAIERNPWLLNEIRRQLYESVMQTGVPFVKLEMNKLEKVFNAIGCALYFHDYKCVFNRKWQILFDSQFLSPDKSTKEGSSQSFKVKEYIYALNFVDSKVSNPEIFQYAVCSDKHNLFYKLKFYEAYVVYLLGRLNTEE